MARPIKGKIKSAKATTDTKGRHASRIRNKDVPAGEKQAASAARQKKHQEEKQERADKLEMRQKDMLITLVSVAKEINVRLEKANQAEGKADDHRLAAALKLEEARKKCQFAKISFKQWIDNNVTKSFAEVYKLAKVGAASEPKKALADMRSGAAARNRALRKRQSMSRDTIAAASENQSTATPYERADQLIALLPDKQILTLVGNKVAPLGMRLVSDASAKKLRQLEDSNGRPITYAEVQKVFLGLKASDKIMFVKWAGDNIGVEVTGDFQDDKHGVDIPESMRREA